MKNFFKKYLKLISLLIFSLIFPVSALALIPSQVNQGGTGVNTLLSTGVLFGNGISPVGTESAFTYNSSINKLTVDPGTIYVNSESGAHISFEDGDFTNNTLNIFGGTEGTVQIGAEGNIRLRVQADAVLTDPSTLMEFLGGIAAIPPALVVGPNSTATEANNYVIGRAARSFNENVIFLRSSLDDTQANDFGAGTVGILGENGVYIGTKGGVPSVPDFILASNHNIGLGQTSPTAVLHIKAGTTAASTAPLKFTSGSLLTSPEAGAVEFLNDAFYGTITTGAARKQFAFTSDLGAYLPLAGGTMVGNILMTSNKIVGGSTTTSDLFLQTTTGVGTTGADAHILVGNNGATEALTVLNNGNVGIGQTSPTAALHLKAGTTAAGTAPLKFTSGSLNTSAEAGAMEFLTDKYYGTISTGTARKEFTLNDIALTSGRVPYNTTNGRLTDNSVFTFTGNLLIAPSFKSTNIAGSCSGSIVFADSSGNFFDNGTMYYCSTQLVSEGGVGIYQNGKLVLDAGGDQFSFVIDDEINQFATGASRMYFGSINGFTFANGEDIGGGTVVEIPYGDLQVGSVGGGTLTVGGDIKSTVAGGGLYIKEGSNATSGVATLVLGTVVVNTTKVTANSRIQLTRQNLGTITVPVGLAVSARTAGTSFTILSGNLTDTSVVAWLIIEPS